MKKYEIQLSRQQLKLIKREFRNRRKAEKKRNEIPRKFLISCLTSGIYIYFGILLNIYTYLVTLDFINTLSDLWEVDFLQKIPTILELIKSVKDLLECTVGRYLVGYPFLVTGIFTVILSGIAFSSMNGKTTKTFSYRLIRIFSGVLYLFPPILAILFLWLFVIPNLTDDPLINIINRSLKTFKRLWEFCMGISIGNNIF